MMPPLRLGRFRMRWDSPAGVLTLLFAAVGVAGAAWLGMTLFILAGSAL